MVVNVDTVSVNNDGFGNRVVIRHADGKATVYAHMVSKPLVSVGQYVKKGQIIGNVGSTGLSTGAHLHFAVIDNYDINPNIYYKGDLIDPILVCGLGSLKFDSLVSSTVIINGVSKNLGDLNKYYGVPSGNLVIDSNEPNLSVNVNISDLKVGDIVTFTGNKHYISASANNGMSCKGGKAKITALSKGSVHPIHLVNQGGGSTVYGWVNAADVSVFNTKTIGEIVQEVIRGDWGNGDERRRRLTEAGYDYAKVQTQVDVLMKLYNMKPFFRL